MSTARGSRAAPGVGLVTNIGRLVTGTDRGVLRDATVCWERGRITWVCGDGARPPPNRRIDGERWDAGGGLVTAGLIDAHTHPLYAGHRHAEIAARSAGLDYRDLGPDAGIGATVSATRRATPAELEADLVGRLRGWLATGSTTVEVKTGYALTRDGELGAVRLYARLRQRKDLPTLSVTFLAAHALPLEYEGNWDRYATDVESWMPEARAAGADSCDVFCDAGYFTVDQARRILVAGRRAGLTPRLHADELARTGGAMLAAELGAASADHLLMVTAEDARALAAAGIAATLCPGTALAMGQRPDVAALHAAGVTIALGSDHNPGMFGGTDMTVVVALAVRALGMSVEHALLAATRGGARALRLDDRGIVTEGAVADLVAWDADHEGAFAWAWGLRPRVVWRDGISTA